MESVGAEQSSEATVAASLWQKTDELGAFGKAAVCKLETETDVCESAAKLKAEEETNQSSENQTESDGIRQIIRQHEQTRLICFLCGRFLPNKLQFPLRLERRD